MFRIIEDPSSGSRVQCLVKNYKNDSTVFVDMDNVCVMAAYPDPLCVCVYFTVYTVNYTHAQRVRIYCHNTDIVHINGHDRIILVIFNQALNKAP
jgi:hypothetical protein